MAPWCASSSTAGRSRPGWNKVAPGLNLRFTGLSAQRYPQGWVLESDLHASSEWRCQPTPCPFGQPGDRLWVRESFADLLRTGIEHRPDVDGPIQRYAYSADTLPGSAGDFARKDYGIKWRPSIHMPREAYRLVLEITAVRVERLQAISSLDVLAEGVPPLELLVQPSEFAFRDLWTSTGGD